MRLNPFDLLNCKTWFFCIFVEPKQLVWFLLFSQCQQFQLSPCHNSSNKSCNKCNSLSCKVKKKNFFLFHLQINPQCWELFWLNVCKSNKMTLKSSADIVLFKWKKFAKMKVTYFNFKASYLMSRQDLKFSLTFN